MIDTVIFRVHNLEHHKRLCAFLNNKMKKTGMTAVQVEPDNDFSEEIKILHKTFLMYHDTGKMIEKAHFNKLKSSHYSIAYHIDYMRDFITFNVSIPKYYFGTNILLYNIPPTSRAFNFMSHSDIQKNLDDAYRLLLRFFDKFFLAEFGEIEVYRSLVEINRIDLCYNQVFHSKQDSLEYLKQLKKIKKKFSRESSNNALWKTTMMYKTARYSWKVYHKGTEFKKNDRKQLEKMGLGLDLEHYQEFSDKMLRYEISVRGAFMSYLYMQKLFRKDCPIWKYSVNLFKQDKAKREGENYFAWKKSLTADEIKHINYAKEIFHKTKTFYLSSEGLDTDWDIDTDHGAFDRYPKNKEYFYYPAHFSKSLFRLLGLYFQKLLSECKLETLDSNYHILKRLDQLNERAKEKKEIIKKNHLTGIKAIDKPREISRSKIIMILNMLENQTMEEIRDSGVFNRMTLHRFKKDLALLGVSDTSLLNMSINADFDLKRYNDHLFLNAKKFPYLKFVI